MKWYSSLINYFLTYHLREVAVFQLHHLQQIGNSQDNKIIKAPLFQSSSQLLIRTSVLAQKS